MTDENEKKIEELHTSFKIFLEEWKDVKRHGFRYCAVNQTKIEDLKEDMKGKASKWVERAFVAIMLLILTTSVGIMLGGIKDGKTAVDAGRCISDKQSDGVTEGDQLRTKDLEQGQQKQIWTRRDYR